MRFSRSREPLRELSHVLGMGGLPSRGVFDFLSRVKQRRAMGALFSLLAIGFVGVAFAAGYGAGAELRRWIIVLAAAALAVWLATMAFRALR